MNMTEITANIIIVVVILAILGVAVGYIIREKKRGSKCIGCPYAKTCSKASKGGCGSDH